MKTLQKNLFIVLEGLSGSGKTTVSHLLAEELNGSYYSTPSGDFSKIREMIYSTNNLKFLFYFYLASIMFASEEIKKILATKTIVCDRYIYTTLCYYRALGLKESINLEKMPILLPDYTFLLVCNQNIQEARLDVRGRTDHDKKERKYIKKILKEYRKYNLIEIDTSDFSPSQIVEKIISYLITNSSEA